MNLFIIIAIIVIFAIVAWKVDESLGICLLKSHGILATIVHEVTFMAGGGIIVLLLRNMH